MRHAVLVLLLCGSVCAQTHTFAALDTDNVFTGTMLVWTSGLPQWIQTNVPNDGTTGTTAGRVAKLVGSTAVNATTTDTATVVYCVGAAITINGVTYAGPGTTGNSALVLKGQCNLLFDSNGATVDHYVGVSTIAAANSGIVEDLGASVPVGVYCVGKVLATVAGNGTGTVQLGDCNPAAGAGYATVFDNGVAQAQRTQLTCLGGISCPDNAGTSSTDVKLANPATISAGTLAAPSLTSLAQPLIGWRQVTGGWRFSGTYGGTAYDVAEFGQQHLWLFPSPSIQALQFCDDTACTTSKESWAPCSLGSGILCAGNGQSGDASATVKATGFLGAAVHFANLGTPANGTFYYCDDCQVANPCAGTGTGALAKRLNGAWVCN